MALGKYPKQTKILTLDLSQVPKAKRSRVKKDIGDFIVSEILTSVGEANSPVAGGKYKKTLNALYADEEKGGDRTANLELDGDMLDALKAENRSGSDIEIGIFKASEQGKADGHNNLSGKSKIPTRQFIPGDNQVFNKAITNGIKQIIEDNKETAVDRQEFPGFVPLREDIFDLDIDDILGPNFFDEFGA